MKAYLLQLYENYEPPVRTYVYLERERAERVAAWLNKRNQWREYNEWFVTEYKIQ